MVKSELLTTVAKQFPQIHQQEAEYVVGQIFEEMIEALSNGDRIEVRGFGTMELRLRKARDDARNPKNGEIVATLPKYRPHFKAGLELRKKANESLKLTEIKRHPANTSTMKKLVEEYA